jgi:DNA-binding response OmpR family regulator
MRVLVVEDEQKVANALREGLEGERYDVVVERTGEDAFFRMTTEAFDLILLDLGLPGRDGLHILTTLRSKGVKTPVLVLTARDTLQDRVAGLDSGADDYLVKPFAFAELLARIRALLRRGRQSESPRLEVGDLTMDLITRKVIRGAQPVELTVREFELLEYLMRYEGKSCRAKPSPATCGRKPPGRHRSTMSSTYTLLACGVKWISIGRSN